MELLSSILPVIVLLLVGFVCRRRQIITAQGIDGLQSLVMNITLPVSLFLTFFNTELSLDTLVFPAAIFTINAVGVPLGRLLCRLFRSKERFLPFAMTTSEDGMLGYTLLTLVVGSAAMSTFALLDMGQVLSVFIVTFQLLDRQISGKKGTVGSVVKSLLTTPILVGMLLGILCSVTGLARLVNSTDFGSVVSNLCDFISAPTACAILVVIGYRINFTRLQPGRLFAAIGMRLLQQGLLCGLLLAFLQLLGGSFTEPVVTISVIAICSLPSSYLLPILVEPEEEKEFYATFTSAYTLLTLVGFFAMMLLYV